MKEYWMADTDFNFCISIQIQFNGLTAENKWEEEEEEEEGLHQWYHSTEYTFSRIDRRYQLQNSRHKKVGKVWSDMWISCVDMGRNQLTMNKKKINGQKKTKQKKTGNTI